MGPCRRFLLCVQTLVTPPLQVSHPVCSKEPKLYNQVCCLVCTDPRASSLQSGTLSLKTLTRRGWGRDRGLGSAERHIILSLIEIGGEKRWINVHCMNLTFLGPVYPFPECATYSKFVSRKQGSQYLDDCSDCVKCLFDKVS